VALVRTGVSEECIASIIRVKCISEIGTLLAVVRNYRVADYFHHDDGDDTFLQNVGSYNSHMA
jgi:hypothetical protein